MSDAGMRSPGAGERTGAPSVRSPAPTRLERYLCMPIGALWLGFLALLTVPVMILMTLLYYLSRPIAAMLPPSRPRRPGAVQDRRDAAA